ncbi:hypothetical protein RRG08_039890 [Elysia crispata]|uniref:Uncharacterized protein n=1 Tax=Elysia crispata TaxID=231223 RepID=A0AAE0ZVU3_9GAST|nr:hypothetical protein RRG08_039890 [Elysia crispata]
MSSSELFKMANRRPETAIASLLNEVNRMGLRGAIPDTDLQDLINNYFTAKEFEITDASDSDEEESETESAGSRRPQSAS